MSAASVSVSAAQISVNVASVSVNSASTSVRVALVRVSDMSVSVSVAPTSVSAAPVSVSGGGGAAAIKERPHERGGRGVPEEARRGTGEGVNAGATVNVRPRRSRQCGKGAATVSGGAEKGRCACNEIFKHSL